MKYPEQVSLPIDIIQRITVYNAIVVGVLKGLRERDKAFMDYRVKDLMDEKTLKDFGNNLPDDTTLSNLHNDVTVVTQMMVNHMKASIFDAQGTTQ